MKKQYQISKRRALDEFKRWANDNQDPVQLTFPTSDIVELAQQGLGELLRKIGRLFIENVLEAEVEELVGARWQRHQKRKAYRWGSQQGFCIVDGQRVPLNRPRVRSRLTDRELPLGSYELFQRASLMDETVWQKIMLGLSMRSYKQVVQQFADAYGLEKSTISEHFIAASKKKLEQLSTRSLRDVKLCALLVDGTIFKQQHLIVAIGIDALGHKSVLGLRQGATENSTVVGDLLGDLAGRGIDFKQPMLYVIDGSAALRKAIVKYAGDAAFIQRCQVHKIRNVADYLAERERPAVKFRMRSAYAMTEASLAKDALLRLHDDLMKENPSAAASLAEGLDHTLTVHELGVKGKLRQSLSCTNGIESSFSTVERICTQVKRWQRGDQRLRWVASGLLFVESRWNRLQGYAHIPALRSALQEEYKLRCRVRKAQLRKEASAA